MAIVNGPLFSLEASGKLGNALVYTKWKGRSVVREYVIPSNPNSFAQRAQRAFVAALNALWKTATQGDKDSWLDLAIAGNYSTFNGFMSFNLDAMAGDAQPTINRGTTPAAPAMGVDTLAATGGVNRVDFEVMTSDAEDGNVVAISMVPGTTAPGISLPSLILAIPSTDGNGYTASVTGIPAGAYAATAWIMGPTGEPASGPVNDIAITVTGVA